MDLLLSDILRLSDEDRKHTKIRFCLFNGKENPKDVYLEDSEKVNCDWLLYKNKLSLYQEGDIAICLVSIEHDLWLLTTVKRITKKLRVEGGIGFEANVLETYRPFFGKLYVSYHKTQQSGVIRFESISDRLYISKIDSESYGENTFKSYKFELTFRQLETILDKNIKDWVEHLNKIQAVYLITDNHNGKHYVGSATSTDEFLISRWRTYVKTLHGGNVRLKELVEKEGENYIRDNFSFRILDYFSENYPQSKVIESESYWKDVFKSREFGYNSN